MAAALTIPESGSRLICGVDLREWDTIIVNTSAGKDSQVMLKLITDEAKRLGVLDRVVAVHCDLGRIEWQGVRELAELQAIRCGVKRFEVVSRPQGDLLEHVRDRSRWPGPHARYCTSDHKRAQVRKLMTGLVREIRETEDGPSRVRVLNCLGLRAAEAPARAKRSPLTLDTASSNGRREVWTFLPIHEWSKDEVWEHIHASGIPYHPAYDLGMPRLSCVFCFYAPAAALALAGRYNRALLDQHVEVEREIGHLFKAKESLAEIRDGLDSGRDFGPITEWEDGNCA